MVERSVEEWAKAVVYTEENGRFVGEIPEWPGFFTYGGTLEECKENVMESLQACINREVGTIYMDDESFQKALDEIPRKDQ